MTTYALIHYLMDAFLFLLAFISIAWHGRRLDDINRRLYRLDTYYVKRGRDIPPKKAPRDALGFEVHAIGDTER